MGISLKPNTLRLKPQPKLSPPPLLPHRIQKPRDTLLLREPSTVKVFPHNKRKRVLANAVLSYDPAQRGVSLAAGSCAGVRGCGGCALALVCAAGCERCWGAEAYALREEDSGVVV